MITVAVIILLIFLIVVIFFFIDTLITIEKFSIDNTSLVKSKIDGSSYKVHDNSQIASDTLSILNKKMINLMKHLKRSYPNSNQNFLFIRNILDRYNPDNLAENSPLNIDGDSSYTINKGSLIALCLRDPKKLSIYDINILMFVFIHELSHLAINDTGHTDKFWSVFKLLLLEGEKSGIYYSPNFNINPVNYCGITISYNPRWDDKILP